MDTVMFVFSFFARSKYMILLPIGRCPHWSVSYVTAPRSSVFNRHHSGNAGFQKGGYIFKSSALGQKLFSFGYLFCGKQFTPRYSTHVTQVANFIESFIVKDWTPFFHKEPPLTFMQTNCTFIGGQV
jgi:hypothetical protein